ATGEIYVASLTGAIHRIVGTGDTVESQVTTVDGQCLHAPGTAAGPGLLVWPCNGGPGQRLPLRSDGSPVNTAPARCAAVASAAGVRGTEALRLAGCSGEASQRFVPTADNELRSGGQCVDHSRSVRRQVQVSACHGSDSQAW